MRILILLSSILLILSCDKSDPEINSLLVSGKASADAAYLVIQDDTIAIRDARFLDTVKIVEPKYDYIQLDTWKWPRLIYLGESQKLEIDFSKGAIEVADDPLNTFLLNSETILNPYSLRWDMAEDDFRNAIATELASNFEIIDSVFSMSGVGAEIVSEIKDIEKLKVAHRTANFISFQERNDIVIDRDIYDFVKSVNLNNKRLELQVNNKNFQYYYLLDKVSDEVPDSIYPFTVIDTVNKYSTIKSIREFIIFSTVKSSFYNEEVDHHKLLSVYELNFEKSDNYDQLSALYDKSQKLKPGNKAPGIGELENLDGELITIDDLQGQNVLLTVWGTWCPYCKEELPSIKDLIHRYESKFTSVGISFDTDQEKWKTYIEDSEWQGIHLIDPSRRSEFKSNYLITGTNVHLLIDKKGNIVSDKTLKPSSAELEELIKKLN